MLIELAVGLKNEQFVLPARYSNVLFGCDYVSFVSLCKHEVKKAKKPTRSYKLNSR